MNYSELLKDDLIIIAKDRGLDSLGTKAEIINRLKADDSKSVSKSKKNKVFNSMLHRYEYK